MFRSSSIFIDSYSTAREADDLAVLESLSICPKPVSARFFFLLVLVELSIPNLEPLPRPTVESSVPASQSD